LLRVLSNRNNDEALQLLNSKYCEFKSLFEQQFSAEAVADEAPVAAPESIAKPVAEPEPIVEPEPEVEHQPAPTPHFDPEFTAADEIAASRQNEMRVDEMLTRREARDLRKAFTLNDKFRFRRELFANNDAMFGETLNLLSAMKNTEEAVEYMRDDLGWDMDSDEVKDFVNIVNNHFA
jgi:hypothetical protein